jgi:hypothetical protein
MKEYKCEKLLLWPLRTALFFFLLHLNIIISIIMSHEVGLYKPLSPSSNRLFKGLPSRLRPFAAQFSIIFGILSLFITVTSRSHSDFIF